MCSNRLFTAAHVSGYLSCVRSAGHISGQISFEGALYCNLRTYDFGDSAPSVDNSPGHWRRSLRHPFVRGKGGGGGGLSLLRTKG